MADDLESRVTELAAIIDSSEAFTREPWCTCSGF